MMPTTQGPQQFVLLPPRGGILANTAAASPLSVRSFLRNLESARGAATASIRVRPGRSAPDVRVLDSIHEDGAKLVEMSASRASDLRAVQPGLRVVPVVYYFPAVTPRPEVASRPKALFSNIGPEIDLTGPGVGIVSTVPGGYAALGGTSMACPAVTGVAARLLAGRPDVLGMSRDLARSDAIAGVLLDAAQALGFGPEFEGQGMPLIT
jgi:hypothetical protein